MRARRPRSALAPLNAQTRTCASSSTSSSASPTRMAFRLKGSDRRFSTMRCAMSRQGRITTCREPAWRSRSRFRMRPMRKGLPAPQARSKRRARAGEAFLKNSSTALSWCGSGASWLCGRRPPPDSAAAFSSRLLARHSSSWHTSCRASSSKRSGRMARAPADRQSVAWTLMLVPSGITKVQALHGSTLMVMRKSATSPSLTRPPVAHLICPPCSRLGAKPSPLPPGLAARAGKRSASIAAGSRSGPRTQLSSRATQRSQALRATSGGSSASWAPTGTWSISHSL
mmetsp:Transcript_76483/g.224467  ORF Transcript_76483/g.224467 Transcript_76483/m.224467 type:complete len:285 (-) Transcript_76483:50-904(-)